MRGRGMNTLELLRLGKDCIFYKENWCQHFGHDGENRYCAIGALGAVTGYMNADTVAKAVEQLNVTAWRYGYSSIVDLNDQTTHDFVMRVYDETITRLTLPGKSKTITVEPVTQPKETPAPEPIPEPVEVPEREPVPA